MINHARQVFPTQDHVFEFLTLLLTLTPFESTRSHKHPYIAVVTFLKVQFKWECDTLTHITLIHILRHAHPIITFE